MREAFIFFFHFFSSDLSSPPKPSGLMYDSGGGTAGFPGLEENHGRSTPSAFYFSNLTRGKYRRIPPVDSNAGSRVKGMLFQGYSGLLSKER